MLPSERKAGQIGEGFLIGAPARVLSRMAEPERVHSERGARPSGGLAARGGSSHGKFRLEGAGWSDRRKKHVGEVDGSVKLNSL